MKKKSKAPLIISYVLLSVLFVGAVTLLVVQTALNNALRGRGGSPIENTCGFDVVPDGHSHSVIEGMTAKDEDGRDVRLTSTGTKFEYVGKLTIEDGESANTSRWC